MSGEEIISCLVEYSRTRVDMNKIEACLIAKADLKQFAQLAYAHGLFPLFFKRLTQKKDLLAQSDYVELKRIYLDDTMLKMQMVSALQGISRLFKTASIEFAVLKGPLLSQLYYDDIGDRQYTDLDILVGEKDLLRSAALLAEAGYTPAYDAAYLKNRCFTQAAKDLTFFHHEMGIKVELHWKLFENRFFFDGLSCIAAKPWQQTAIGSSEVKTLNSEMLLLYLCIHAAWHDWQRLIWINDIDRLVRNAVINWQIVLQTARKTKTETILYSGISLSHRLYDTPLPQSEIEHLNKNRRVRRIVYRIVQNLNDGRMEAQEGTGATIKKVFRYMDGSKLRYLVHMLLNIKPEDILSVDKQYDRCFFYFPFRFIRLFSEFRL